MSRPVKRLDPAVTPAPVVFDSPHSGTTFPDDFDYVCPPADLLRSVDAYVDELFAAAPTHGAPLIHALFPRCYIDPNRALEDLDPDALSGAWPETLSPGEKTERGIGLVWRRLRGNIDIYDRKLAVSEVQDRIRRYWQPYHTLLEAEIDALHAQFGAVWHINCHSMPAVGDPELDPDEGPRADFVLGDRDGTSCEAALTGFVASALRRLGYSVKLNDPYKGVELVRRYADPQAGRHSLQLEINRRLYMDEASQLKSENFDTLQAHMTTLIGEICAFAHERLEALRE